MTEHKKQPNEDIKVEETASVQTPNEQAKTDYVSHILDAVKQKGPPLLKKTLSVLACAAESTSKALSHWAEKIQVKENGNADPKNVQGPKA